MVRPEQEWPLPVFGLTGSIASGKTTLGRMLADLGTEVIDADSTAHRLVGRGRPAFRDIVRTFGRRILDRRGRIDRARLGGIVFRDPVARARLEAILHPAVMAAIRRRVDRIARTRFCPVVIEAALLAESGYGELLDGTIVVVASRAAQIDRLARLRGLSADEARLRIRAQWPSGRKSSAARWIVPNDGSLDDLAREALGVHRGIARHPVTVQKRRAWTISRLPVHGPPGVGSSR